MTQPEPLDRTKLAAVLMTLDDWISRVVKPVVYGSAAYHMLRRGLTCLTQVCDQTWRSLMRA